MKNLYANSDHTVDYRAGNGFELNERNYSLLKQQDDDARQENRLVGRIVRHGHADGYAVYQIVKENKKTVTIKHCNGIGDDWILPAWGLEARISKDVLPRFLRPKLPDLPRIVFKR